MERAFSKLEAELKRSPSEAELAEEMRERTLSLSDEDIIPNFPSSSSRTEEPSVSHNISGLEELELPDTVLAMESFFLHGTKRPTLSHVLHVLYITRPLN